MLITGALLGAGGDIVGQMISNQSMDLSKIDWGSVALSGLAGGATGLLSATGAGPVAMGIMGGVSSGASEIYHQMQSGEDINWGQVAIRTLGGAVSGAVLGNVGSQTASGAKEIAKNAGKVFLANGGVSFAENLTYNLIGGEDLGTAAKQASFSALISGGTSAGFYALGQAAKNMCFVEGTMVLTAAGLVAIESIAVGDMVIATDPETGETAEKQVKNTFVNETEELAHVFVDGEEIVCTPGHKFYAAEKGWTSAIKLRAGDQLQLVNGEYVTVEKVQHELLEEPVKVYNFEVEDFHTYYVGADVQVLVHNKKCGGKTRLPKKDGHWDGEAGNSNWISEKPEVNKITNGEGIPFKDGRPDFSQWSKGEIQFNEGELDGTKSDFKKIYEKIKNESNGQIKSNRAAKKLLKNMGVTPHHFSETEIQLIPTDLHRNIPHIGSASDMRGAKK